MKGGLILKKINGMKGELFTLKKSIFKVNLYDFCKEKSEFYLNIFALNNAI